MFRFRPAAVLLAASLLALVLSGAALLMPDGRSAVGVVPDATDAATRPESGSGTTTAPASAASPSPYSEDLEQSETRSTPGTTDDPTPPPPPTAPAIPTRSAAIADLPVATRSAPTRLAVDGLGIDAPVTEVGVEPGSGAMVVPEDPAVAGWYAYGPSPGDPGSAVVTAHVDSRRFGVGPFERLRDAEPGTPVTVAFEDGSTREFVVTGRRQYAKSELPVDDLFRRDGEPTLALVTCGGAFDPTVRRYEDNVVVYAVPA